MRVPYFVPVLALLVLTACGSSKEDNQITETRMDSLDSLEGTISDDMINTDESTDEAPVEAPPPADGKAPATDDKTKADKTGGPAAVATDDKAATE